MNDVFKTDGNEVIENAYETLVGEGKKFGDNESLAKAKIESDRYIARLLQEQAEMRDALQKRINEEEFLTKLESLSRKSPEPATPPVERDVPAVSITPDTIEDIIEKREAIKARNTNLNEVEKKLQEVYGDEYKRRVQTQAQQLGVGTDFLTDVAGKNPQAFYRLMGIDQNTQPKESVAPPRSTVTGLSPSAVTDKGRYAYWAEQRRQKGDGWYFSTGVQQQLWNELTRVGEDKFYS